jgi:hypothetical protein
MNEPARELDLIRTQLLAGIERDLHERSRRSRVAHLWSFRIAVPTLAVLAAATAAIVLALIVSAASPQSASAAARRALAATAAAPSGMMTTTVLHGGVTDTLETTRWNGSDIAFSPGVGSAFWPGFGVSSIQQLLLIGSGAYVQTSDGSWLHYANASDVAPKPLGAMVQFAHDNIASTTPQQILALATNVQKTPQSDGTTLYTGTIPSSIADGGIAPSVDHDPILSMIFATLKISGGLKSGNDTAAPGSHPNLDLQLQMSVGSDGLVRQVSLTFQQADTDSPAEDGNYTWSITYGQLGSAPPITAPASSTDVPPGTLPPGTQPPGTQPQNTRKQNTQTPPITLADRHDYLKAAACICSHGLPDFPNPTFGNNTVTFNIPPNIDPNSSRAKRAAAICAKLIPPGLPYSNRSAP